MTSSSSPKPTRTFQADQLEVRLHDRQASMAQDAAQQARDFLRDTIARRGGVSMILAAANSQIQFLDAIVALGGVDWSKVSCFHMDEYLGIRPDHPASFRRFMRERVEDRLHPGVFHYLQGDAMEPLSECDRYSALLTEQKVDLCCLGIGENGHIAFNDPPVARFDDPRRVKIVKLDEACRRQQVGEGHFPDLNAVPQYAVTLTIPMLCDVHRMLCIVPEARKAQAVKDALERPVSTACPASWLRCQKHCTLFLDADSAGLLSPA